jgi:hypothetical protein
MSDKCPVCGMPVKIIRRQSGAADHYEPLLANSLDDLPEQNKGTEEELRQRRRGKKTVALVGAATTSCSLAPYGDLDVEIWAVNEEHAYKWMKRATRWFQMHKPEKWRGYNVDWMKANTSIPIYMQFVYPEIPMSIEYPLQKVIDRFFHNVHRKARVRYLTSSFGFMMALALMEDFNRIEIYGFEMSEKEEYINQKACAEFWMGYALGMEVELYLPPKNQLLEGDLYGYQT